MYNNTKFGLSSSFIYLSKLSQVLSVEPSSITINSTSLLGSGNLTIEGTQYTAGTGININASNEISNTITSYNDLTNLPTIPTTTSELINDSNYVRTSELSEVAFTGNYNALSGVPEIPSSTSELVNDGDDGEHPFISKEVNNLTNYTLTSNLSSVATSGDYNDLSNLPTIPTTTSELTNDSGYITASNYGTFNTGGTVKSSNGFMINSVTGNPYANTYNYSEYTSHTDGVFIGKGTLENALNGKGYINSTDLNTALSSKQDTLVSGTNIKTINNNSILGNGNLNIAGGSATDVQINGTSITSGGTANIITESAYDNTTNKIATMNDVPSTTSELTNDSNFAYTNVDNNFSAKETFNNAIEVNNGCTINSSVDINTANGHLNIGAGSTSYCNYNTDVGIGHYFNKNVYSSGGFYGTNTITSMGNNTNGSYIKWDNGLMVCYKTISGTIDITTAWGSLYVSSDIDMGNFAESFISRPSVNYSANTSTGTQFMLTVSGANGNATSTSAGRTAIVRPNSRTGVAYVIDVIAIGLWK